MSIRRLLNQTVEVVTYGPSPGRDDLGKPIPGTVTQTTHRALMRLSSADEVHRSDNVVGEQWTATLGPGVDIGEDSLVLHDGRKFEVIGTPDRKSAPGHSRIGHTKVRLSYTGGTS